MLNLDGPAMRPRRAGRSGLRRPNPLAGRALPRPGLLALGVGLAVMAVVGYGGGWGLSRLGLDRAALGLLFTGLSGVAGLAGFAAAVALGRRPLAAYGLHRVSLGWLGVGAAVGVVAFGVKGLATLAFIKLTGDTANVQAIYAAGGGGGPLSLVLATLLLAVVTPIGEELLFRGVVTNALLRYGPIIGVVGGAAIFALMHGVNIVLPAAMVAGLAAGEVFRRSGSVWPGVVVHVVLNLPTVPVMLLAGMTT